MSRFVTSLTPQEEGRGGGARRLPHEAAAETERAAKVNERMPMFVGLCVIVAITFVLSRDPEAGSGAKTAAKNALADLRNSVGRVPAGTVPEAVLVDIGR